MNRTRTYLNALSVALLSVGSAILLISCSSDTAASEPENIPTMRGDTLTIYETEKGRLASKYYTPLMEKYGNAPEPYDEYKYGVEIFQYDTLGGVKSTFRANYAIHFINLDLWETKGDVVVTNEAGNRLETQQLFWNRKTGRIYSNVDSHFHKTDGLVRGESFEANEDLSDWEIRSARGEITVDVEPTRDTSAVAGNNFTAVEAGQDTLSPTPDTHGFQPVTGAGQADAPATRTRQTNPSATPAGQSNPPATRLRQGDNPPAVRTRRNDQVVNRIVRDSVPVRQGAERENTE